MFCQALNNKKGKTVVVIVCTCKNIVTRKNIFSRKSFQKRLVKSSNNKQILHANIISNSKNHCNIPQSKFVYSFYYLQLLCWTKSQTLQEVIMQCMLPGQIFCFVYE